MSDDPKALKDELAALVEETRRHLEWMDESGIRRVRREVVAPAAPVPVGSRPAAPAAAQRSPVASPQPARIPVTPRPEQVAPMPSAPVRPAASAAPVAVTGRESGVTNHAAALQIIREDLGDCKRCGLCTTRNNIVFGQGNPNAELVFVGEGPGEDEDTSGLAFVGRAGQLLTKMIEAMGFTRDDVFICNIVKCRPPGNRRPEPAEIEACRPFVERQLRVLKPKVVVTLGATATQALLRTDTVISKLRNTWQVWDGLPVMPTFHPSYLLRAPQEKAKAWDDLKLVMAKLGKELPKK